MIPETERKVLIDNWVHTILKRDAANKYFDIIRHAQPTPEPTEG